MIDQQPTPRLAIALNRFGLGARPGDATPDDPAAWLAQQIVAYQPAPPALAALPGSLSLAADYARARREADDESGDAQRRQQAQVLLGRENRRILAAEANGRIRQAVQTDTPFAERLVHFWANHFAVSTEKFIVQPLAGSFEREAIRPHVMGRFEDMLLAAERHAAMQLYLDQAASVGDNSRLARAARRREATRIPGLNENLAREILELHTLGVRSGYGQQDVTEFARALTGWSVEPMGGRAPANATPGSFVFRPGAHEPGARVLLGQSYAQPDEDQPLAMLRDLARAPATARHVATKLARHFAGDEPSAALVDRLAGAFQRSQGHLPTVYQALIDAPQAWDPQLAKFKSPWDWLVSALRATAPGDTLERMRLPERLAQLGQPVWRPGSPAGWPDTTAGWAAPDALLRRVEVANQLAYQRGAAFDARTLAFQVLCMPPGDATRAALAGADGPVMALALLLVSPEFQRR